jgi:Transcriptional regulator, AbiEi antitoxin
MTLPFLAGVPALLDDRFPLPLDGPFTTAEARKEGISAERLTSLVRSGLLRRPVKGVYVAAQVTDSQSLRGRILSLVVPPGSVVTDWSACWFWTGIDRPGSHLACPPLSVFRFRGHERLRNPLVESGQRSLRPSDVVAVDGHISVTTPIRTAWDLGRFSPRILAIGGMDALVRHGPFDVDELVDGVERFRKQRGVVRLRSLAPVVDPRSESMGESSLRLRWLDAPGMPQPQLQIPVRDAAGQVIFRIDLGVEELRFGAEYDGEEWHSSEEDRKHDDSRRAELKGSHRWHIVVFRREDVYGQHEDATTRLPGALVEARRTLHSRGL